jgi:hypothetical protein
MEASLVEVIMWAKFQVKIRKYNFAGKLGSCRENSLKFNISAPEAQKPEPK